MSPIRTVFQVLKLFCSPASLLRLTHLLELLEHAHLGVALVAQELGVHALGGHLTGAAGLLHVPVRLLVLVVVGVVLGLGHLVSVLLTNHLRWIIIRIYRKSH